MLVIAIIITAAMVAAGAVALRRKRARRTAALAPQFDPLPAGVKHLAATMSDLSDLGLHLPAAHRAALARKPRLGVLLGLR